MTPFIPGSGCAMYAAAFPEVAAVYTTSG